MSKSLHEDNPILMGADLSDIRDVLHRAASVINFMEETRGVEMEVCDDVQFGHDLILAWVAESLRSYAGSVYAEIKPTMKQVGKSAA